MPVGVVAVLTISLEQLHRVELGLTVGLGTYNTYSVIHSGTFLGLEAIQRVKQELNVTITR